MKTERNILVAFLLNLFFSVFELIGGSITGSVAIVSDAIHDVGDAASIGISYYLEKKSKREPNDQYTYGYARYSVIGGFITTLVLLIGSVVMIYHAAIKLADPTAIHYNGMIGFAVVGVAVNFCAAFFTRKGDSVNQKAVNLHMLEDVLGWVVVLIGAVVMKFTDFALIDPIMSIGVSSFILINAIKHLKTVAVLFLEKAPANIDVAELKSRLETIEGVCHVHHIHLWSIDAHNNLATLHAVTDEDPHKIKQALRAKLREYSVEHVTIEIETGNEYCDHSECHAKSIVHQDHHHHHH